MIEFLDRLRESASPAAWSAPAWPRSRRICSSGIRGIG